MALLVGAFQDPVRKVTPGTPAILVLSTLPIWAVVLVRARAASRGLLWPLRRTWPGVALAIIIFAVSLLPATLRVLAYGPGAWRLAVLGLFAYGGPLLALLVGFVFPRQQLDLERLLRFYCLVDAISLLGTPLEYFGWAPEAPMLGTAVLGNVWYRYGSDVSTPIRLISGIYRSPDVMGWHAATLAIVAATFVALRRGPFRLLWLVPMAWGVLCVFLSGRRKMILMPVIWATVMALAYLRSGRFSRIGVLAGMLGASSAMVFLALAEGRIEAGYYDYASTLVTAVPDRVVRDAIQSPLVTLYQSGFLGVGIGVATQGHQHTGIESTAWQESGPSKLVVELGLPGALCGIIFAAAVARAFRRLTQTSRNLTATQLQFGLVAFTVANVASFLVSHQVYGDALISVFTAFICGVALASPRWTRTRRPAATPAVPGGSPGPRRFSGFSLPRHRGPA